MEKIIVLSTEIQKRMRGLRIFYRERLKFPKYCKTINWLFRGATNRPGKKVSNFFIHYIVCLESRITYKNLIEAIINDVNYLDGSVYVIERFGENCSL